MKMTLLELSQNIANKMNSDEFNSIGDSTEATQIAMEVVATYYDMIGNIELPDQYNLISFDSSLDTTRPTHMSIPERVDNFKWIEYNYGTAAQPNYVEICYLTPDEFVAQVKANQQGSSTLVVQDYGGSYLTILTNGNPRHCTSIDDKHLVFDSYDASVDDTLQASKVRAYAQTIPTFEFRDDAYPDLPVKYFPQLLAEATQACMFYWKQSPDPIDQMRARRQLVRHFNNRNRKLASEDKVPNYGRT